MPDTDARCTLDAARIDYWISVGAQPSDAVRILTAHRAKGLEWREVWLIGVEEGVWPDLRSRGSALHAEEGREIRFGIRMHVINRDTSAEAWAEADRLLENIDPATIKQVQDGLKRSEIAILYRVNGQSRFLEEFLRDDIFVFVVLVVDARGR